VIVSLYVTLIEFFDFNKIIVVEVVVGSSRSRSSSSSIDSRNISSNSCKNTNGSISSSCYCCIRKIVV